MAPDIRSPKCPGCGHPPSAAAAAELEFPIAYCPNAACYVVTWNMWRRPVDHDPLSADALPVNQRGYAQTSKPSRTQEPAT